MPTFQELEALTSKQLHDRAVRRALKHLDLGFFLELLGSIPAAEMVAGHEEEAGEDIASVAKRVQDFLHADEGELADALRPIYVDYLLEHDD
ncbi:MAG TPA: hypothetical protein VHJ78_07340 [Actinomycetota bacterium]|nr:hypothetical protein [Actinomycetota bacterium]